MARTYLHLGVVYLEGLKDREKALRNFGLALRIRPSIEVTPALASDDVILEFEEVRAHPPAAPTPPPEAVAEEANEPATKAAAKPVKLSKKEAAKAAREAADSEKAAADAEDLRKNLAATKGEVAAV